MPCRNKLQQQGLGQFASALPLGTVTAAHYNQRVTPAARRFENLTCGAGGGSRHRELSRDRFGRHHDLVRTRCRNRVPANEPRLMNHMRGARQADAYMVAAAFLRASSQRGETPAAQCSPGCSR